MHLATRLAKHFTAAAAAAALATTAQAQVATTLINQVVPANIDGLYINAETGATGSSGGSVAGWDINPYSATSLTWFNATGAGIFRLPGATTPSSVPFTTVIDATGVFSGGASSTTSAIGAWTLNADNYFGFKFVAADGLTHYGWGRMTIGAALTDRTMQELYWEQTGGVGIAVGDTGGVVATSVNYGTGCGGLTLTASGRPVTGTSVAYTIGNIPGTTVLSAMVLGLGGQNAGLDLTGQGLPGCFQYVDLNTASVTGLLGSPSTTFTLNVPNDASLLGLPLNGQGVSIDPAAAGGAVVSDAVASVVGGS